MPLLRDAEVEEVLAIDLALERLAQVDERALRVVECRIFAGLTLEETAQALGISGKSVQRTWTTALAWLRRRSAAASRPGEARRGRVVHSRRELTRSLEENHGPHEMGANRGDLRARPRAARRGAAAVPCRGVWHRRVLRDEIDAMLAAAGGDRALAVERLIVDSSPEARDADPWLGTCLGPWRLVDVLGRGGMGTVYRAERADGQYQQEVALKLVRSGPRDPYAIERLRTERQVLAHLRHPNIAGLLDGGFASDGTPYLVMELVDGVPINEWCAAERLSLEASLRLFRVVCDAVQHAHRALDRPPRPQALEHLRVAIRQREIARLRHREAARSGRVGIRLAGHTS